MILILLHITSLIYIIVLAIFYFIKKRISNIENNLYKNLLLSNVIGLIVELGCFYGVRNYESIPLFTHYITRLLLIYYLYFLALYTTYVFVISYSYREKTNSNLGNNHFYKKISRTTFIIFILLSTIISFMPMDYYFDSNYTYSYGTAVNFLQLIFLLVMSLWGFILIKNHKNIKKNKYVPIVIFVVLAGIGGIIQKIYPYVLLTTPIETLIIFLMYFTIENPDKKILDELHNAKVISDNANEEKTIFLYNMTNEIRGITKDINGSAEEILEETTNKKINKEIINDSAREIIASTARFNNITNEILDVSSIDSQGIKVYDIKYNIKVLLTTLKKIYEKKCNDKELEFRFNIQSDTPEYLYGDAIGLKQVLGIILDNSVKYTEKGYVEVSINNIRKNDIYRLVIEIEDSGIGMKSEEINELFIKDYVIEDSLDLKNNLYNARRLLTLMNGTMIANSTYGKGTKIKIIIDQRAVLDKYELNKYKDMYNVKKILFVGVENYKLINKLLKNSRIELESVNSSKELIDKFDRKEKYDLILMEEEANAFGLIKRLKEIRSFNSKAILLSSDKEYHGKFRYRYLDAGFIDCILLPLDKKTFEEQISKYL